MTEKEKKEAMEVAAFLLQTKATDENEYNKLIKEGAKISDAEECEKSEEE